MLKMLLWREKEISSNIFRENVKRLHCIGLINMIVESSKLIDNVHLQLFLYFDEIKNAFENHEIYETFKNIILDHS
jgi:hypothetical protein